MTLQIGMIGKEGILLASDQCGMRIENGVRHTNRVTKFVVTRDAAFAFAGDEISERIARLIAADFNSNTQLDEVVTNVLKREASAAWAQLGRSILAIAGGELWRFDFGSNFSSLCRIFDKTVTGDSANAAVFFTERYYLELAGSIDGLKKIAAHAICMGGKLNPAGVQGLEMVLWYGVTNTLSPLNDSEIKNLCDWSEKLDGDIGKTFAT